MMGEKKPVNVTSPPPPLAASVTAAVGELLASWGEGDRAALGALVPLLYDDLHRVAHQYLRRARPGHTLQTTALVHEAYLRLEQYEHPQFKDRVHFTAICALLMRQILTGHERTRRAAKRGAGAEDLSLENAHEIMKGRPLDLLALDDALTALARLDPQQSRVVELRFFGGMSIEETAEAMGLSPATVKRLWSTARLWLLHEISGDATA